MKPQTFQMANRLESVDPMVLSLGRQVEGHLSGEARFRFDICAAEVLTNLVLHAKTTRKDAPIDITITGSDGAVTIEFFDPDGAEAFDLRDHVRALSDVDAMAESGRGLGLILECADSVAYGALRQRNRLCLKFQGRE